jgi:hypothetical protein
MVPVFMRTECTGRQGSVLTVSHWPTDEGCAVAHGRPGPLAIVPSRKSKTALVEEHTAKSAERVTTDLVFMSSFFLGLLVGPDFKP